VKFIASTFCPSGITRVEAMNRSDRRLLRELSTAVAVKMLLILGLWFVFFDGRHVQVDADSAVDHLLAPIPPDSPEKHP